MTHATPRVVCAACSATLELEPQVLPADESEAWDSIANQAVARGWSVRRDDHGRRCCYCTACASRSEGASTDDLLPLRFIERCRACGSFRHATAFCRGRGDQCVQTTPHLHFVCRRCGHEWKTHVRRAFYETSPAK